MLHMQPMENIMYNNCEFIGNLGNDPEVRVSTNANATSFTTFSIAVNKPGDKEAKPLWVNITAFGKTGEYVGKYLKKGNTVLVNGSIELQEYEGKDGKTKTSLKLIAGKVVNLSKREEIGEKAASVGATASKATDDDIPF